MQYLIYHNVIRSLEPKIITAYHRHLDAVHDVTLWARFLSLKTKGIDVIGEMKIYMTLIYCVRRRAKYFCT